MLQSAKKFRIGRPQIFAGLMLLGFLAQCLWLAGSRPLSDTEIQYITSKNSPELRPVYRANSPFTVWVAAGMQQVIAAVRSMAPGSLREALVIPRPWLIRAPFAVFGIWLGGALWWVARRLFDDAGGYMALVLYCSSPAMVMISSNVGPEILLAWSTFGLIYTAIGVAHTLYAPPRKWIPRVVILGLAIGFALSTALWSVTLVVTALAFMLYLAPGRRRAALAVMLGASLVALVVAGYLIWWAGASPENLHSWLHPQLTPEWMLHFWFVLEDGYIITGFLIAALVVYASWPRARYFGNTAPLLTAFVAVLVFALIPSIHVWETTLGLSFIFVFIGGVASDLLETPSGQATGAIFFAGILLRFILSIRTLSHWIHQNIV
jgi:hypothetical protein